MVGRRHRLPDLANSISSSSSSGLHLPLGSANHCRPDASPCLVMVPLKMGPRPRRCQHGGRVWRVQTVELP